MHAEGILAQYVRDVAQGMHRARSESLLCAVRGLMRARRVGICAIGRAVVSTAWPKHRIKRVDRLVGNRHLHQELRMLSGRHIRRVVGRQKRPLILVDWTQVNATHWALCACLALDGRALPLLQRVWRQRVVGRARVHAQFIAQLQACLPDGCQPILITDAGFKVPWFRAVLAQGWDVVGRLSVNMLVQPTASCGWRKLHAFAKAATAKPQHEGSVTLTRSNPLRLGLVTQAVLPKGRKGRAAQGRRAVFCHPKSHLYKRYQHRAKTPWLIGTSLQGLSALQVVRLYAKRMQCEETFRDVKNPRFGLGADMLASRTIKRLEVLLLLAALALTVAIVIGQRAEHHGLQRHFQANSHKKRRVLSYTYLGLLVFHQELLANTRFQTTSPSPSTS